MLLNQYKYHLFNMKYHLLLAFLLLSAFAQDESLFTSDSTNAESSATQGASSDLSLRTASTANSDSPATTEAQDSANVKTDYLRDGSSWVIVNNPSSSSSSAQVGGIIPLPIWTITLTSTVYTDCPQNIAVLNIVASGPFVVFVNNVQVASGSGWTVYNFKIKLNCGCNTIKIVIKAWWGWGGAAYSVTQNTAGCYDCQNLGVTFYNKKTCQCECVSRCQCDSIYSWFDYPSCGCKCKYPVSCLKPRFFSWKSCSCQCQPLCCPKGYTQSSQTCLCVKQTGCTPPFAGCPNGQYWDSNKCACLPVNCQPINCGINMSFNTATCQCEYLIRPTTTTPTTITSNNGPCANTCMSPFILKSDCTCGLDLSKYGIP